MAAKRRPAKRKGKKAKGGSLPWLRIALISVALVFIAFFSLMQAVRSGAFGDLPSEEELASIQHEQATLVLDRDGRLIGKLFAEDRTNVRYTDLPKHLVNALVATEDARFFSHQGVDGRSYVRVFFRTLLGRDRSGGGGSTISQQIIKNLYGRGRHGLLTVPVNKMKEALVAQRLERILKKEDVLLLYFNSVPFGENTFGIEAAAQRYFGKPAKRLNIQESAVLVGMLKANTSYNPRLHPEASKNRRDQVFAQMQRNGDLTGHQVDSLKALPLVLNYSGGDALDLYGYFVRHVKNEALAILKELKKSDGTPYDIEKDGLRITTTLDADLQRMAHIAAHQHLAAMQPKLDAELKARKARGNWERGMERKGGAKWRKNARGISEVYDHAARRLDTLTYRDSLWHYHKLLNGAVLMMEPNSGAVRAWVGGNDHRYLPYDLVTARRPIASTIKPVVYAAALERGLHPCTYLDNDRKTYAEFDGWAPDNFDKDTTGGQVAMWYALTKSMNRPTVDLYFRTGADTVRSTMAALGLPTKDADKPAMSLGATDIALKEIVPAFGAFAMQGRMVKPQYIASITDAHGRELYQAKRPKAVQAISENTAADVTAMLQSAIDQGTDGPLRSRFGVTSPIAGKTGTSQDYGDAWFVAYTPGLVIGTWVGAFDNSVHFSSSQGTGGSLALPIAGKVLKQVEQSPELRQRYIRPFVWPADHTPDLECRPRRDPDFIERLIHDAFGGRKERQTDTTGTERRNIFDRLFKGKKD
ncbi:MAG: transglycosylase domain-containing protein [Flavobacteriales bacterium]|nr:transglycosylase domain-containing protein [Flavobacteriales bacterium]